MTNDVAHRSRRSLGVAVLAMTTLVGCGGAGSASPPASAAIPSASVATSPASSPPVVSAPPSAAPSIPDAGPLALTTVNLGMEALATGTLEVTDHCTFLLIAGYERATLAWPAPVTVWDAAAEAIVFTDRDGQEHRVGDGDAVRFGGGGSSVAEGGLDAAAWVARHEWVVPPDPACVLDVRWLVSSVLP